MLTDEQIKIALSLPASEMVVVCLKKIKLGQMDYSDMVLLCEMRMQDDEEDMESVAKDIGLV